MSFLKVRNLKKTFYAPSPIPLIRGVDLDIERGECVAILGRSGDGKTTLLHLLGLLDQPTEGEIFIDGEKASKWNSAALRRKSIGFVFQAFHLLEELSPIENLLMASKIRREETKRGSANYKRAEELLEAFGLKDRLDFSTKLLSGGEKQRVALARALLSSPPLILADEPTGNLDSVNAAFIQETLLSLSKNGTAVVVVTHDEQFAKKADRSLRLSQGVLS
jgi:lipoprotein-releasing system ATP-binding protein